MPPIRLTSSVRLVMDLLTSVPPEKPAWGLRICELTQLGPGTVYPILARLQRAGWLTSAAETEKPTARPPRRLYEVTDVGRDAYAAAVATQAVRLSRWTSRDS